MTVLGRERSLGVVIGVGALISLVAVGEGAQAQVGFHVISVNSHFDGWAATFGEVVDTMEISPDGASLRPRSRFARFTNLPELQSMFRAFADVQTAEMLNLPRPRLEGGKPTVVACPMSEEQQALQQELVERYERLRSQKVDPRVDNALNITTDGRKLATDARMLSATAPDFPESKVNRLVENVAATWKKSAAFRCSSRRKSTCWPRAGASTATPRPPTGW